MKRSVRAGLESTLLCISSTGDHPVDVPADIAAPLVESCLALGGDAPALAEQLLAWRAVSEPAATGTVREDYGCPAPVALLALIVLRAAADPGDARLADPARTVADASREPGALPGPFGDWISDVKTGGHAQTWRNLITTVLAPGRGTCPDVDRLVPAVLG